MVPLDLGVCTDALLMMFNTTNEMIFMERYDFDTLIDRRGTNCTKYDGIESFKSDYNEVLPLWIADMDFATPSPIGEAIKRRLEHPVLGYTIAPQKYYSALQNWFAKRYGFTPKAEELMYTPGVVSGIYKMIQCLTEVGDGVVIMPPVYYPFFNVTHGSGRKLIEAPLNLNNHEMQIDWERLDQALSNARALIISHPHNPGGRVWRIEELQRIAELAKKHNAYIISDEIHADLTFPEHKHHPFPSVSQAAAERTVTLMAPSKAFNMPGVIGSHLFIKDENLRKKVFEYMFINGLGHAACYTFEAITSAYEECGDWLDACLDYIKGNVLFVKNYLEQRIPKVKMIMPEASFLIFLDCEELGLKDSDELNRFFIEKAGLYLDRGSTFGTGGEWYMRLNVGESRKVIEEAMKRLENAVNQLK